MATAIIICELPKTANPNAGEKIELGNGAGFFDEREIVDAGFLELRASRHQIAR